LISAIAHWHVLDIPKDIQKFRIDEGALDTGLRAMVHVAADDLR